MGKNVAYTKKNFFLLHGLINCCLASIIGITVALCSFLIEPDAIIASKTYNGVIYAGNEKSNKVALMINVYWGTEYLNDMLNILDKYNVKCTFFVGETWVNDYPQICQDIYNRGHEIGNHGTNHKEHGKLDYQGNYNEINKCTNTVERLLNIKMNLFAPPGGGYNSKTVEAANDLNYKTILWTKDTIDWRDKDEKLIFERATKNVVSGDLILMHPTEQTKNALEGIIEMIISKKLTLDTVSNTIKD